MRSTGLLQPVQAAAGDGSGSEGGRPAGLNVGGLGKVVGMVSCPARRRPRLRGTAPVGSRAGSGKQRDPAFRRSQDDLRVMSPLRRCLAHVFRGPPRAAAPSRKRSGMCGIGVGGQPVSGRLTGTGSGTARDERAVRGRSGQEQMDRACACPALRRSRKDPR